MTTEIPIRKRRSYRKSLFGCRNCKLRRVKCDETKPQCRKCISYGVICNYVSNTPDLHVSTAELHARRGASRLGPNANVSARQFEDEHLPSILQTSLKPIVLCSDGSYEFRMNEECFAGLERFGMRAIGSFSKEMTTIWRDKVPKLAFSSPYLMHTILAVAAAHERHYDMAPDASKTLSEAYHTARATYLMNQKLSSHLTPADYDALWATAALLGLLASTAIDTPPEHSWPLTPPSSSDLEWFILTDGKKAVWNLTNPLRPSSVFSGLAQEYAAWDVPIPLSGKGSNIDPRLASLCGITDCSTPNNNPYFAAAHVLASLQALDPVSDPASRPSGQLQKPKPAGIERVTIVSQSQVQCLELLKKRDKAALILLALWYQRCEGVCWWLERRARIEGRAIRLFLKQHYPDDKDIFELLPDLDTENSTSVRTPNVYEEALLRVTFCELRLERTEEGRWLTVVIS